MRSCQIRLEQIAEPENLREAFLRAAKGKSAKADVIAFRVRLDEELFALRNDLLGGTLQVGHFTTFTIFEPKERRIHAPCFLERVLHHAIIAACEPDFERWLIDDSYACRRGRGREKALRRAEKFAAAHPWFLKLDVRKYFDSIPHAQLMVELGRRFRDPRLVALWRHLIASYQTAPGRGLPIGALTSQHLANFYLGPVDRLIKEELRLPGYVRYMDDMALWGGQAPLKAARRAIEERLGELGLTPKQTPHLQPCRRGMDFLGYRVQSGGNRVARSSRRRFLRKWGWIERAREAGAITEAQAQRRALAAFLRSARRETLLRRIFGHTWGIGHRAPTASTAAAAGTTQPRTAAPRIATGTSRATAITTSASASPSAHALGPAGPTD